MAQNGDNTLILENNWNQQILLMLENRKKIKLNKTKLKPSFGQKF